MTADDGFADWVRSNPPPDLQELVARHGGYDNRAMAEWQEARRHRHVVAAQGAAADPEALCLCGIAGVYMRPRKGGGRPIWRCEEHRNRWPDYAIEAEDDQQADADERTLERIEAPMLERYQDSICDYEAADDFGRSIDEASAAIRAGAVARGGNPP